MKGLWCKKVGMTQLFQENGKVVPVTALAVGQWRVTQIKTDARDGYNAVQIGLVRNQHLQAEFSAEWLLNKTKYFSVLREVPANQIEAIELGSEIDPGSIIKQGDYVHLSGKTIGRGFQGGVKRHGFAGGPGSHGGKLGRKPGSMGFMRSRGRVIKGWRMAGHMGVEQRMVRNIPVIATEDNGNLLLVKGSVPGKTGSLIVLHKV